MTQSMKDQMWITECIRTNESGVTSDEKFNVTWKMILSILEGCCKYSHHGVDGDIYYFRMNPFSMEIILRAKAMCHGVMSISVVECGGEIRVSAGLNYKY